MLEFGYFQSLKITCCYCYYPTALLSTGTYKVSICEARWNKKLLLAYLSALPGSKGNDIAQDCRRGSVLLLKAFPGHGCQRAVGERRLAADREIIQLNLIRVHQQN